MSAIPAIPFAAPARSRSGSPAHERDDDDGFELALGAASALRVDSPPAPIRDPENREPDAGSAHESSGDEPREAPVTRAREADDPQPNDVPGTPGTVTNAKDGAQNVPPTRLITRPGLPATSSPAAAEAPRADQAPNAAATDGELSVPRGLEVRVVASRLAPQPPVAAMADAQAVDADTIAPETTPAALTAKLAEPVTSEPAREADTSRAAPPGEAVAAAARALHAAARARPRATASPRGTPAQRPDAGPGRAPSPSPVVRAAADTATSREQSGKEGNGDPSRQRANALEDSAPASPAAPAPAAPARTTGTVATARPAAATLASGALEDPRLEPMRRVADQVTLRFEGENGLEGRLRIAVRGETVRASILSSDAGTLQRLGNEVASLRRALAEQGFTETKVIVHDTRPAGVSDATGTRDNAHAGGERRQGEPQRRSGQGREFRHDSGSGSDPRTRRDERRSE